MGNHLKIGNSETLMRIVGKNFKCFSHFDINFEPGTNNVVLGDSSDTDYADSNGAGKTTLGIHALCWVRYGKYPGMSNVNSPINLAAGKGCEVYHEFTDTSGNPCIIKRSRKPTKLEFWQNGTEVSGDKDVVQEKINAAIGCDYDFYVRVFLYTGADEFKFAKLTDAKQKAILDTILPMDFDKPRELAVKERDKIAQARDNNRRDVANVIGEINTVGSQIREEEQQINIWETQKQSDWAAIEQNVKAWGNVHAQKKVEYDDVCAQASETLSAYTKLHDQVVVLRKDRTVLEQKLFDEKTRLASLSGNADNRICPTCHQRLVDETALGHVQQRVTEVEASVAQLEQQVAALPDSTEIEQEFAKASAELDHITGVKEHINNEMREAMHHVETGTAQLNNKPEGDNPHIHACKLLSDTLQRHQDRKAELDAEWNKCEDDLKIWDAVVGAFGAKGLKHYAFETLCPELTATAHTLLKYLSPEDLDVEFRSHSTGKKVKEGFHIAARRKGGPQNYSDLSGGERARIDLVVFLTLFLTAMKHVSNTGIVVFDEIADTLDDTGKQMVVQLLDFFSKEYGVTCLMLTNDKSISSYVSRGYCCKRTGDVSEVERILEG